MLKLYSDLSVLLHPGIFCLLCLCGVYIRHYLPPLHPCPMVVFRCQHLRMGPVCLAHRLVNSISVLTVFSMYPLFPQKRVTQRINSVFLSSTRCIFVAVIERGVCLPTVSLWILFVYIEAAIRFKDIKNFHVDLCRPFAAHW